MHKQKKLFNNIHYDKFILLFNQSRCYLFDKHQLLQLLSVNSRISSKSWPHIIILLYASYMQASSILLTARGHINGVDGTGTGTYISTVERDLFNFVINSRLIISTEESGQLTFRIQEILRSLSSQLPSEIRFVKEIDFTIIFQRQYTNNLFHPFKH